MARAKGTCLVDLVKLLRSRPDEAREALAPALHRYLEDRILDSAWYPEEDLAALLRAGVEVLGQSPETLLPAFGMTAVRSHADGTYAHLFRRLSSDSLGRLVSVVWTSMHDSGAFTLTEHEPGRGRVELSGYGHPSGEMCGVLAGYGRALIEMVGGRGVTVRKDLCVLQGDDRCAWDFTWTEGR